MSISVRRCENARKHAERREITPGTQTQRGKDGDKWHSRCKGWIQMCAEVSELAWAGHNAAVRKTKAARKWINLVSQPNEPVVEGLWLKQEKKPSCESTRPVATRFWACQTSAYMQRSWNQNTRCTGKCTFVFPVSASYPQRMLSKNCLLPLVLSISPFRFGLRFFFFISRPRSARGHKLM